MSSTQIEGDIVRQVERRGIVETPSASAEPAIPVFTGPLALRKQNVRRLRDASATRRAWWIERARFFHNEDLRFLRFLIPQGSRVLEIGCGTGHLLAALEPSFGVGVDFSAALIGEARAAHPRLNFLVGDAEDERFLATLPGPYDVVLIPDTIGELDDCQRLLEGLHRVCRRETRIVIVYISHLWWPGLKLAELLGLRMPQPRSNVLAPADIREIAALADFETVKMERRMIAPFKMFGLGRLLNRFVAVLPLIRAFCLRHYTVCRSLHRADAVTSATIVIPVRNERDNIEDAIARIPAFTDDIEIIFVEGHSADGTGEEIERVIALHPDRDIKAIRQPREGKADAVFAGLNAARGDVLMILDGDLTMPPEQLPKFWQAIRSGKGELVSGSRLVYPRAQGAMRFLNLVANKWFAVVFTWLLSQRVTDVLCGTKALRRDDFQRLKAVFPEFGTIDPFGDFDLIFGAAKLGLKIIEVPIRYDRRTYGESQIARGRHGLMLLRALLFAFLRIKAL